MKVLPALFIASLSFPLFTQSQTQAGGMQEFLPPLPAGKEWKLIWHDDFEGAKLDETKWNRLGDSKRRDGYWIKDDAYLSGKGTLLLRTRKDGDATPAEL